MSLLDRIGLGVTLGMFVWLILRELQAIGRQLAIVIELLDRDSD